MPSHSIAQRKKMAVLYEQGKITEEQWNDFKHIVNPVKKKRHKSSGNQRKKRR